MAAHPASADPFLPVPPASFLNYHVGSAEQLAQEVTLDAVVRARLAHHFHQSEPQVARYVQDNLVLTHLRKPGVYRVACVTPSGREYFLNQHLAAGTGVFALKTTGEPILKQACGNPLVAVLPAVAPHKVAPPQMAASPKALPAKTAAVEAALPSDVVFTATPPLQSAATGSLGPFVKVAGITQSLGHSGGGGLFPAVLGVAGLGLFAGHHGSPSSSLTTTFPLGPVPSTPTAPTTPTAPLPTTPTTPPPVFTPPVLTPPTTPITPTTPTTPITPTMPPVFTPPPTTPPVFTPPVLTPPTTTPPFIGPPPVVPPSQSAVPEPGAVAIFGLGSTVLGLLRLRARRRGR